MKPVPRLDERPAWCKVGATVKARPASVRAPLTGAVREITGNTIVLEVTSGMLIAVRLSDCRR